MRRFIIALVFVFGLFFLGAMNYHTAARMSPVGEYTNHYIADSQGPTLTLSIDPEEPRAGDEPTVTITAIDEDGVNTVILSYWTSDSGSWTNKTTTSADSVTFTATLPITDEGTNVTYKAYANDSLGNWATSSVYSYITERFDQEGPVITLWYSPDEPDPGDEIMVYAAVGDPSDVAEVYLSVSYDGNTWTNQSMTYDEETTIYMKSIGSLLIGQTVYLKVYASDTLGNWAVSETEVISLASQSTSNTETSTTSTLTSTGSNIQFAITPIMGTVAMGAIGFVVVVVYLFFKYR